MRPSRASALRRPARHGAALAVGDREQSDRRPRRRSDGGWRRSGALRRQRAVGAARQVVAGLSPELVQALRRLPVSRSRALLLVVWGELSYEEAARALEVPRRDGRSHRPRAPALGAPDCPPARRRGRTRRKPCEIMGGAVALRTWLANARTRSTLCAPLGRSGFAGVRRGHRGGERLLWRGRVRRLAARVALFAQFRNAPDLRQRIRPSYTGQIRGPQKAVRRSGRKCAGRNADCDRRRANVRSAAAPSPSLPTARATSAAHARAVAQTTAPAPAPRASPPTRRGDDRRAGRRRPAARRAARRSGGRPRARPPRARSAAPAAASTARQLSSETIPSSRAAATWQSVTAIAPITRRRRVPSSQLAGGGATQRGSACSIPSSSSRPSGARRSGSAGSSGDAVELRALAARRGPLLAGAEVVARTRTRRRPSSARRRPRSRARSAAAARFALSEPSIGSITTRMPPPP